jgi:hypothetical protein
LTFIHRGGIIEYMAFFEDKNRFITYAAKEKKKMCPSCHKELIPIDDDECDTCRWGKGDPAR